MVFNESLSDNKSHQVSWTLLGGLADLNNAVVWICVWVFVSMCQCVIFNYSSPFTKPLGIILTTPITIGITITSMFYGFITWLIWEFSH